MNPNTVEVIAYDGPLKRERWLLAAHDVLDLLDRPRIVLDSWFREEKATPRHKWRTVSEWSRFDNRRNRTTMPPYQAWVFQDARAQLIARANRQLNDASTNWKAEGTIDA